MSNTLNFDEIAKRLRGEAYDTAQKLAPRLFPKNQLGRRDLSTDDFMAYTARHWREPEFRQQQLKQMGSRAFLDLTNDLWRQFPAEALMPPTATPNTTPPGQMSPESTLPSPTMLAQPSPEVTRNG